MYGRIRFGLAGVGSRMSGEKSSELGALVGVMAGSAEVSGKADSVGGVDSGVSAAAAGSVGRVAAREEMSIEEGVGAGAAEDMVRRCWVSTRTRGERRRSTVLE